MTNLVINPVAFHLGNLSVKWYGIIMAVAIVLACWMAINEGKKRQIIPDDFVRFAIVGSTVRVCWRTYLLCDF